MNNKNNSRKIKVLHLSNKINKNQNSNNSPKKKLIESYNNKSNNKLLYYINKKINIETSITSDKNNNLSLFSFLSSNTNQEEKLTNKSLRTTRETESNYINNKRNKIKSKSKSKRKIYNNNIKKNININKELDKFKTRIDNLFIIITNFENNFIKSERPKLIKQELNKIINKKYFNKNNSTHLKKCSKSIKNIKINITIEKENTHRHKKSTIFNSVNNINTKNTKKILTKNKLIDKKNNITNTYNRRMKYGLLLNENSNKKIKTQRDLKNKENNKTNKNNNKSIYTNNNNQHCSSKSIDIKENEIVGNMNQKNKKKENEIKNKIKSKNIYINSNFNKTPRIRKIEGKIK